MALTYTFNPSFPLAHAMLDTWEAWDQEIIDLPRDLNTFQKDKLSLISDFILQELETRSFLQIPTPYAI